MPTFTFTPITATSWRVTDTRTREHYGTIRETDAGYRAWPPTGTGHGTHATRDDAAQALYRTRAAFGFEAGVL